MTQYRTLYVDSKDEGIFVGGEWTANTTEEYDTAVGHEMKIFAEIPVIDQIIIAEVKQTINKEN